MTQARLRTLLAAIAIVALAATGCGGSDEPSGGKGGLEKTSLKVGILTIGDLVPFGPPSSRATSSRRA